MDLEQNSESVQHQITRLASKLLDQQIDPADEERLAWLMESDANARAHFIDFIATHVLLVAMHEPVLCLEPDPCEDVMPPVVRLGRCNLESRELYSVSGISGTHRQALRRSIWQLVGWGLASCLLIASGLWFWVGGRRNLPAPETFVGVLSKARGTQWSGNWQPNTVPARLAAGDRLCLDAGTAELTLNSGCTIVVKGPADLTLDSSMHVLARHGIVRARVGDDAHGFVIETPITKVVDLGTEFGVQVDALSHSTNVVVFEGAVDLGVGSSGSRRPTKSREDVTRKWTRLASGEALRVDRFGTTHRIISVRSEEFPTTSELTSVGTRLPLIQNITDNIRDPSATVYYQIVRNGLREDSRAYVDRFHEWNGVDKRGIPPFLLGADYVMCFNSDKWNEDLEISLDLAGSIELFVLFDDRLPVPSWLSDQFVQTGYKIGVDEGFPDDSTPQRTSSGAGKSIDNVYSIWKRVLMEPAHVRLGSLPKRVEALEAVSMYGIAAVPLEEPVLPDKAKAETL